MPRIIKNFNLKLATKILLASIIITFMDQLHKYYMLEIVNISIRQIIEVTSFFNLVMVWNQGISFGLFQNWESSHWFFTMVAIIITSGLLIWVATKETSRLEKTSIIFIIGGALGNVVDRIRFGAVADFFDFHAFGYHYPAFNIADMAVFLGAAMLIISSFKTPMEDEVIDEK